MTRRLAVALFLVAVTLGGAVGALAGTVAHRRAAYTEARRILRSLKLPADAHARSGDPSPGHLLAQPFEAPATPALVDRHAFWSIPGAPRAVLTWIESHPPAGSFRDQTAESGSPSGITTITDGYSFGAVPGVLAQRELIVTVARGGRGETALRADAEVIWSLTRSASERVPEGVTRIVIKLLEQKPLIVATLTRPARIRRVVKLIDHLPAAQPGVRACPNIPGPAVLIDFLHGSDHRPIAALLTYNSDCVGARFTVRGRTGSPLGHGRELIRALASLTGLKLGG